MTKLPKFEFTDDYIKGLPPSYIMIILPFFNTCVTMAAVLYYFYGYGLILTLSLINLGGSFSNAFTI